MPKPEQAAYDAMDLAAELRCPVGADISPLRGILNELYVLRELAAAVEAHRRSDIGILDALNAWKERPHWTSSASPAKK